MDMEKNIFKIERNGKTYEIEVRNNYVGISECIEIGNAKTTNCFFRAFGEEATKFTFSEAVKMIEMIG